MKNLIQQMVLVLLILSASLSPAIAQSDVPPDFELSAMAGGVSPWTETVALTVAADGTGTYTRYIPGDVGTPPIEEGVFALTSQQLEELWQTIQLEGFFSLDPEHVNPDIQDRTFAELTVHANGASHVVTTQNAALLGFDDILTLLNGFTPGSANLEYDTSDPPDWTELDVCDQNHSLSVFPPDIAALKNPGPGADHSGDFLWKSTGDSAHPGTSVAYRLPLQEAVTRGIASLSGKGGFYGDQVSIAVDNSGNQQSGDLKIKLYLEFWGSDASEANVNRVKNAIENAWKGTAGSGANITTEVVVRRNASATSAPGTKGFHQIELVNNARSSVSGRGTRFDVNRGTGSGQWRTSGADLDGMYAHEVGHLLGLPDRYNDYRKQSDGTWKRKSDGQIFTKSQLVDILDPKYPNLNKTQIENWLDGVPSTSVPDDPTDLMSTKTGSVKQSDLDALKAQAGVIVEIRPGDVLANETPSQQNFAITRSEDIFVENGMTKTVNGLWAACTDLHDSSPSFGSVFDLAPSLSTWSGIEAASLFDLLSYVDQNDLFCDFSFETQLAIWRITDNLIDFDPTAEALLLSAGVDLGDQILDYPRLSSPDPDGGTGPVNPPELSIFSDGFESGNTSSWSISVSP
ncbi:MAG TPA: hypothetical protein VGG06_06325 [Thermoanaerobaculia bacterium]